MADIGNFLSSLHDFVPYRGRCSNKDEIADNFNRADENMTMAKKKKWNNDGVVAGGKEIEGEMNLNGKMI